MDVKSEQENADDLFASRHGPENHKKEGNQKDRSSRQVAMSSVRHATNAGERISPWPLSSILKTSMKEDLSRLRMRQTPSLIIVCFSPSRQGQRGKDQNQNLESKCVNMDGIPATCIRETERQS